MRGCQPHQPAAQTCVLAPSSPYRWALLAPGTQAPGIGTIHLVMDGDQNQDFVSRKRLGGVLMAAGTGVCAGGAPFYWNRASGRV